MWSSRSRRQLPTQRSATPFCQGLRMEVRTQVIVIERRNALTTKLALFGEKEICGPALFLVRLGLWRGTVGVTLLKWWLDDLFRHYVLGFPNGMSCSSLLDPFPFDSGSHLTSFLKLQTLAVSFAACSRSHCRMRSCTSAYQWC
jgi:hypothetical protein